MTTDRPVHLETRVVHAGSDPARHEGALSTPVYRASLHRFENAERGAAIHEGHEPGTFYGRIGSPTQAAFEEAVRALEGGEAGLALASGMGAITVMLWTVLEPGDHVVAAEALYTSTGGLLRELVVRAGVDITWVNARDLDAVEAALRPDTRVLYVETPSNPTLRLVDLRAISELARPRGITTIVDSTFATPVNQRPLELGIDVVVHSATKYLGGHGDLVAGVAVGPEDIMRRARWHTNKLLGAVIAPDVAWLALRGLRTLALRMERHNANALTVATFLERHPRVEAVHYPGLASHPQHELAVRQMDGFGGMLSFDVGSAEAGRALVDSVRLCSLAVSLGDVATLVQHSASMTQASVSADAKRRTGVTEGLIRLSVGIERAADIVADLDQALAAVPAM